MGVVLKENDWAEQMIKSGDLGKKPSETLKRVARYYLDKGYTEREARRRLDAFLIQCDPLASLPKWSDALDYALSRAMKFPAVDIEYIPITASEMGVIDSIDGVQPKRLAFTLLCLAKYWMTINPDMNGWVVNKDSEIMKIANVSTSSKRQSLIYHKLNSSGLIQFSKKVDNTNIKVNYIDDSGDVVLKVTDFRNLGYQYLMYHNGPYFVCENCGITTKTNSGGSKRNQKFCKECSVKIRTRQHIEAVMRYKNK